MLWPWIQDGVCAGAYYTGRNPSCRGNVLRYNYFADVGSDRGHGNSAIYFDDGDGGNNDNPDGEDNEGGDGGNNDNDGENPDNGGGAENPDDGNNGDNNGNNDDSGSTDPENPENPDNSDDDTDTPNYFFAGCGISARCAFPGRGLFCT